MGLELGISIAVGYFIGDWLDGRFGTHPWLSISFLFLGIAAGFRSLLQAARRAMRDVTDDEKQTGNGDGNVSDE